MIDVKYKGYLFSFFMALFMSGIMSLVISIFNVGLVDDIVTVWLRAWAFAFAVALPAIVSILPVVNLIVTKLVRDEQ